VANPTFVFCCGAECGIAVSGATPGVAKPHWDGVSGTGTGVVQTGVVHPGGGQRAFKFTTAANFRLLQTFAIGAGATAQVVRFFVYFDVLPSSGQVAIFSCEGANESSFGFDSVTGQFATRIQGNSWVSGGPAVVIGKWYRIDLKHTCGANPNTIDWQVDGAAQVQNSAGFGASTWNESRIGAGTNSGNNTSTLYIDELAISGTSGDYPIGDGRIIGYSPNADGTHSFNAGTFQYENSVNVLVGATDVFSHVDEAPLTSLADFIKQVVAQIDGVIDIAFPTSPETVDPRAVTVVAVHHSLTTPVTGQDCIMRLQQGGGSEDVYVGASWPDSSGLVQASATFNLAPLGGPWTLFQLSTCHIHWGQCDNVTGTPCLDAVMLEVEYPPGTVIRDAGAKSQYYNALIRM